jgi:hypothetical protein
MSLYDGECQSDPPTHPHHAPQELSHSLCRLCAQGESSYLYVARNGHTKCLEVGCVAKASYQCVRVCACDCVCVIVCVTVSFGASFRA